MVNAYIFYDPVATEENVLEEISTQVAFCYKDLMDREQDLIDEEEKVFKITIEEVKE